MSGGGIFAPFGRKGGAGHAESHVKRRGLFAHPSPQQVPGNVAATLKCFVVADSDPASAGQAFHAHNILSDSDKLAGRLGPKHDVDKFDASLSNAPQRDKRRALHRRRAQAGVAQIHQLSPGAFAQTVVPSAPFAIKIDAIQLLIANLQPVRRIKIVILDHQEPRVLRHQRKPGQQVARLRVLAANPIWLWPHNGQLPSRTAESDRLRIRAVVDNNPAHRAGVGLSGHPTLAQSPSLGTRAGRGQQRQHCATPKTWIGNLRRQTPASP